jgi:hypothetical protein
MKRFFAGLITGLGLAILLLWLWQFWLMRGVDSDLWLFTGAKQFVERELPGAHVLDVSVSPDSHAVVNYEHDKLFDVDVSYERAGKIKKIVLTFGKVGRQWISPNTTEVTILDDKAEVLHSLSGNDAPAKRP